jgi:hypothetical protein
MSKKLTPKQAKFVKGIAEGKTKTDSYIDAYDVSPTTPRKSLNEMASQTSSIPQVKDALEQLFGLEETKQIVANVHKLAISAEDEKIQLEASKEWLGHVIPKSKDSGTTINFNQVIGDIKDKYSD